MVRCFIGVTGELAFVRICFSKNPANLACGVLDKENFILKHKQWKEKVEQGMKKALKLNARFARWYYIIPAESFKTRDVSRRGLI